MTKLYYARFYSASGIYEPDPDMDKVILKSDEVTVRLLGFNKYAAELDGFLISPEKRFTDLDENERKRIKIRRNSYLAPHASFAVLYIEVSILLKDLDIKSARDSEGVVWSKLPHKTVADSAFASVATAIALSRPHQVSKNYDCILDGYYAYEKKTGGFQKFTHNNASSSSITARISGKEIVDTSALSEVVHRNTELRSVATLFSAALTPNNNGHLHSFIAAWTGLEIFIAKQFKELQASVQISVKGERAHKEFSGRMLEIMKDKYRLLDKFAALSNYYCESDADADIDKFKSLKRVRDNFFHSMEGEVESLPLNEARQLLEKYLRLHLQRNS